MNTRTRPPPRCMRLCQQKPTDCVVWQESWNLGCRIRHLARSVLTLNALVSGWVRGEVWWHDRCIGNKNQVCNGRTVGERNDDGSIAAEIQRDYVGRSAWKDLVHWWTKLLKSFQYFEILQKCSPVCLLSCTWCLCSSDIVIGLLKKIQRKRDDLRIIVASATLDAENFYKFFNRFYCFLCFPSNCVCVTCKLF